VGVGVGVGTLRENGGWGASSGLSSLQLVTPSPTRPAQTYRSSATPTLPTTASTSTRSIPSARYSMLAG
jgi:hypothetical protein